MSCLYRGSNGRRQLGITALEEATSQQVVINCYQKFGKFPVVPMGSGGTEETRLLLVLTKMSLIITCPTPPVLLTVISLLNATLAFLPLHRYLLNKDWTVLKKDIGTVTGRVLNR